MSSSNIEEWTKKIARTDIRFTLITVCSGPFLINIIKQYGDDWMEQVLAYLDRGENINCVSSRCNLALKSALQHPKSIRNTLPKHTYGPSLCLSNNPLLFPTVHTQWRGISAIPFNPLFPQRYYYGVRMFRSIYAPLPMPRKNRRQETIGFLGFLY